ncbi:MAG: type II secretion system F family protein [Candidatus Micrarchaeia archaeon]
MKVPFLLLPPRFAKPMSRPFVGIGSALAKRFKFIEKEIYKTDQSAKAKDYATLCVFNAFVYFALVAILAWAMLHRLEFDRDWLWALVSGATVGIIVFMVSMVYPRWLANKRIASIDKELLFAARHLRIQVTAGVPLFESIVSASHGYGSVSDEFEKVVTQVQAGMNLADALEDSAMRTPSYYYSRILWQMANGVKAGTEIGPVLSDIVEFLAEEQRIEVRNYGAQLNTLAILYLMVCIIVPTISLIFLMVISSFVDLPITDTVLGGILGAMIFIQYMFIGLIESRRPAVSI